MRALNASGTCHRRGFRLWPGPVRANRTRTGRPSRLLFVLNDTGFFASHRLPIAVAAKEVGYEVHLAAHEDGALDQIERHGIQFHPLRVDRTGTNPLRDAGLIVQLARLVAKLRPELMHCVTIKPVVYGGMVARVLRVPGVVSAVSGLGSVFVERPGSASRLHRLVLPLYRTAFGHPNSRVIFQNPDDREHFVRAQLVNDLRTVLIRGSGVDVTAFHPVPEPEGEPVVVMPSRLLWEKGVGEFVEAARILRAQGVAARFALVGEPPAHNRASVPVRTLQDWVAQGIIEWWGFHRDMPAVYRCAHVVCLPSYYREGVPKVLIEAAACGRPIVTTDTPGCREVARDGENGVLVPPRDTRALADALRFLLEDSETRRAMGARGRQVAISDFSLATVVHETLAVYRQVAPNPQSSAPRPQPA